MNSKDKKIRESHGQVDVHALTDVSQGNLIVPRIIAADKIVQILPLFSFLNNRDMHFKYHNDGLALFHCSSEDGAFKYIEK